MGEKLYHEEIEALSASPESRWGDVERILEILRAGEIRKVIKLEEIQPDLEPHSNVVQYAELESGDQEHMNVVEEMEVQLGGQTLKCIFKPKAGENPEILRKCQEYDPEIRDFYHREIAAYLIDAHFGLDVVPPTVEREIPGQGVGSLRIYADHELYDTCKHLPKGSSWENLKDSPSYQGIAVLDWLIANWDRKSDDYLFRRDEPQRMVAIDNGFALTGEIYRKVEMAKIRGPHYLMTFDDRSNSPRDIPLPEELRTKIQHGLEKKDHLTVQLQELGLPQKDIDGLWQRTEILIKTGKFLSRKNTQISDLQS